MSEEKYKTLNGYLNLCFNKLSILDELLLNNILNIDYICIKSLFYLDDMVLEDTSKKNNLTFNDIYKIAREIIESIDKQYLKDFDNLIPSGKLDFGYNGEYDVSEMVSHNDIKNINIARVFNYDDVLSLVHEFIHYTHKKKSYYSDIEYYLSEFLAIYFELYATNYLIKNLHVDSNELNINFRISDFKDCATSYSNYSLVLLAFHKFGNISSDTYKDLSKLSIDINKIEFDRICLGLLQDLSNIEKKYIFDNMYEDKPNDSLQDLLYQYFSDDYIYILGSAMAFFALENCNFEDIVYLNSIINNKEFETIDILYLLNKLGIDLNDELFVDKVFSSIYRFLGNNKVR